MVPGEVWTGGGQGDFEEEMGGESMSEKKARPGWWPENPYPESIFPMPEEQYLEIVPDPEERTALSGMLGRQFWDIASEAIWAAMLELFEVA